NGPAGTGTKLSKMDQYREGLLREEVADHAGMVARRGIGAAAGRWKPHTPQFCGRGDRNHGRRRSDFCGALLVVVGDVRSAGRTRSDAYSEGCLRELNTGQGRHAAPLQKTSEQGSQPDAAWGDPTKGCEKKGRSGKSDRPFCG